MQGRSFIYIALVGLCVGLGSRGAQGQPGQLTRANIPMVSYLGVATQDVSAEMAKTLKLPEVSGVEVTKLDTNSPAAAAGIKVGDVVMQYNGQRVENWEQFARMVRETPPGREVKLQIYRDGAAQIIAAKIALHAAMIIQGELVPTQPRTLPFQGLLQDVPLNRMSWGIGALGAEMESLEGQLADYFGVKDGVLVRSVMRGSAAERAGLRAGDVITRVGDAKVTTPADVSGRIRTDRAQSAMLTLLRDHKEMNLTIALDGIRLGEQ
jgi:serine protease Do